MGLERDRQTTKRTIISSSDHQRKSIRHMGLLSAGPAGGDMLSKNERSRNVGLTRAMERPSGFPSLKSKVAISESEAAPLNRRQSSCRPQWLPLVADQTPSSSYSGHLGVGVREKKGQRQGVAVVEVAVCLPVLLVVTLLFIEFSNLIFVRQTLKAAGYEGIRVAIKQGTELEDVLEVCENILDRRQVREYQVSVAPETFSTLGRGSLVTVNIQMGKAENRLFGLLVGDESNVEINSYGLKE